MTKPHPSHASTMRTQPIVPQDRRRETNHLVSNVPVPETPDSVSTIRNLAMRREEPRDVDPCPTDSKSPAGRQPRAISEATNFDSSMAL